MKNLCTETMSLRCTLICWCCGIYSDGPFWLQTPEVLLAHVGNVKIQVLQVVIQATAVHNLPVKLWKQDWCISLWCCQSFTENKHVTHLQSKCYPASLQIAYDGISVWHGVNMMLNSCNPMICFRKLLAETTRYTWQQPMWLWAKPTHKLFIKFPPKTMQWHSTNPSV